jgi:hypothetical protein
MLADGLVPPVVAQDSIHPAARVRGRKSPVIMQQRP